MLVKVCGFNANINISPNAANSDLKYHARRNDILLGVETRRSRWRDWLPIKEWGVHQNITNGPGRANGAIAWRKSVARWRYSNETIGVDNRGLRMFPRYIVIGDVRFSNSRVIRFFSFHEPPARFRVLRPFFHRSVAKALNSSPHPWVAYADWNMKVHGPLGGLRSSIKGEHKDAYGFGIDGFLVDERIKVAGLPTQAPKLNSDHRAVYLTLEV